MLIYRTSKPRRIPRCRFYLPHRYPTETINEACYFQVCHSPSWRRRHCWRRCCWRCLWWRRAPGCCCPARSAAVACCRKRSCCWSSSGIGRCSSSSCKSNTNCDLEFNQDLWWILRSPWHICLPVYVSVLVARSASSTAEELLFRRIGVLCWGRGYC